MKKILPFIKIISIVFVCLAIVFYLLKPSIQIFSFPLFDIPLKLSLIIIGGILFVRIILDLFKGNFGADLLAALALVTSFLMHEYLAGSIIVLMLLGGEFLEEYAKRKASNVLKALSNRMPNVAHIKTDERIEDYPINHIKIGDKVVIFPHETCPVDGVVVDGHGSMDESYLTGEPYRVSKAPGSNVLSGAVNGEAVITIQAERLPKDSRYATIMKVMQAAEEKRPHMRRVGDKIGAFYAPIALLVAVLAWILSGDPTRFLTVLVIATPCPLLIGIPIAIISAISIAARKGIIIKDPSVLENLPLCRTAIFDKTGTLTYGRPEVQHIIAFNDFTPHKIIQLTASLERYSKHPLASAILRKARDEKLALREAQEVSEKPGSGLKGKIGDDFIWVTNRQKLIAHLPDEVQFLPAQTLGLECILVINDKVAGIFQLRDKPRADGHAFIEHLGPAHRFDKIMLVSGDRESEVKYLAEQLGITEVFASQSPEEKLHIVEQEVKNALTLFMGDGINDAPALAVATVGLAFGQQSAVTGEAAGAVILENTLIKVDELLHLSIDLRKIVLQTAIGGMALSFIGVGFAAFGWMTPVWGAIVQEVIDVLAILNALRLIWKSDIQTDVKEYI
jgi:heavy metal translocating P-type ATPase